MPPKVKITREDIIQTALELVRAGGEATLNARLIAAALRCSTQPVFSNFATMEELQRAVLEAGYEFYLNFLKKETESGQYPTYKAMGWGYIRFAYEEKELFKLLFMRDRGGAALEPTRDFEQSVALIMEATGLSHRRATQMHMEIWAYVHGIAVMLATSFLQLEWEMISDMTSDVYHGLRMRHIQEEKQNGSHSD